MITKFAEFIKESKNYGDLYHFIHPEYFTLAVENGVSFRQNDLLFYNDTHPHYKKYPFAISATRYKKFEWRDIRITFNSDAVTSRWHVEPIHFFNFFHMDEKDYRRQGQDSLYNQFEERIFSKKENDHIPFNSKFIKSINFKKEKDATPELTAKLEELGIPHTINEREPVLA